MLNNLSECIMYFSRRISLLFILILCIAISLCACGSAAQEPTPVPTPVPTPAPTPTPTPEPYSEGFDLCGRHYTTADSELDLTGITEAELPLFEDAVKYMKSLQRIVLGDEIASPIPRSILGRLIAAAPDAAFSYGFTLYGQEMNLSDEYMDLRKIKVDDDGAAIAEVLPYMTKCTYVDLDGSGVSDSACVALRDAFPGVKIVWRVYFSWDYSARTDVKSILCSLAGTYGLYNNDSTEPLKYFTDLVNLDAGHNNLHTNDMTFLESLPNLEVLVFYEGYMTDISPIAACKNLRYLELTFSAISDISALANLDKLTDLDVAGCYNLEDISPIIPADKLPNLRRFYCAGLKISEDQLSQFQRNHPNCEVDTNDGRADGLWRFKMVPCENNIPENRTFQYQAICDIFHYRVSEYGGYERENYNFTANDPYFTIPHGEDVVGNGVDWFYGDHHYDAYGIYGDAG